VWFDDDGERLSPEAWRTLEDDAAAVRDWPEERRALFYLCLLPDGDADRLGRVDGREAEAAVTAAFDRTFDRTLAQGAYSRRHRHRHRHDELRCTASTPL
jgi:hypothetical protein